MNLELLMVFSWNSVISVTSPGMTICNQNDADSELIVTACSVGRARYAN